ncbi:MAG TPA: hypothetical protein ENK58_09265 [Desulfobacterales bacterium]|nr:hypothetical protein [Desulfobacterales bacterium]
MILSENLPKNYKGYLATELFDLYEQRRSPDGIKSGTPKEKIRVMAAFLREYQITPAHKAATELIRR